VVGKAVRVEVRSLSVHELEQKAPHAKLKPLSFECKPANFGFRTRNFNLGTRNFDLRTPNVEQFTPTSKF
jgi:hypothetical protein